MEWYTVIVHVPWHVAPVQYFHTRAGSSGEAARRAQAWLAEPNKPPADIEFVFAGRLQPVSPDEIPVCEHGVEDYEYCEACSKEYKRAAREAGLE